MCSIAEKLYGGNTSGSVDYELALAELESLAEEEVERLMALGDAEDNSTCDVYMPSENEYSHAEGDVNTLVGCSPSDAPWDVHRASTDHVVDLYVKHDGNQAHADKMRVCSEWLVFYRAYSTAQNDEEKKRWRYKLAMASFCRVRGCPVCMWRRSLRMKGIAIYERLPEILQAYPTHRFLFLTLTVRNCAVSQLKITLHDMNEAWRRFRVLTGFKNAVQGWFRSVEFTRGTDGVSVHPHFHILLHVSADYFSGHGKYMSQKQITQMWKECLRVDYTPVVNVKAVKRGCEVNSIKEVMKYTVKESDIQSMIEDGTEWYVRVYEQLAGAKLVTSSGTLRFLATRPKEEQFEGEQDNKDDLIDIGRSPDETEEIADASTPYEYYWSADTAHYISGRRGSRHEKIRGDNNEE